MARLASQMLGGYYAAPPKTLALLVAAFQAAGAPARGETVCLVDPFAGKGEAVAEMARAVQGSFWTGGAKVVTSELEYDRSKACSDHARFFPGGRWQHHHGDAFHLELDVGDADGATVLYLNPPYDTDTEFGRVEERALVRFTDALAPGGLLLYLIPKTAIAASAETLAKRYEGLRWYRLPDGEYEVFSQVLCIATKRYNDLDSAGPEAAAIRQLTVTADNLPPLAEGLLFPVPARKLAGFERVAMHSLDVETLQKFRPWFQTTRGRSDSTVQTVFPAPGTHLSARGFKSAVPPRPSHIAYAMASGVFNGARVAPNADSQGLPELLVKGQFARKYKVKEEVFNADGELSGTVQVQQPELTITVLRLDTHALVTLAATAETSDTATVTEGFTIGDLFTRYGDALLGALLAQCKVTYNPQHNSFDIPEMDRHLFPAQKHTVRALTTLLGGPDVPMAKRVGTAGILLGELGCGKTSVALGVQRALGRVPTLVLCPPHLLESWRIEASKVAKDVEVQVIRTPQDVDRFCASKGPVLGVMSREGAKLGSHVVGVRGGCPRCGAALPTGDLASRRARCKALIREPRNAEARVFDAMLREGYAWLSDANMTTAADYMGASHARLATVARRYRVTSDAPEAAAELRKAERKRLRRHLRRADVRAQLAEALWSAFDRGDYGLKGARRNRVSAASLARAVFFAVNDPAWARAALCGLYDRAKGSETAHIRSTIRDLVFWCTKSPEDAADFDAWAKSAWKPSYGQVASAKEAWSGLKSPNGGTLSWEGFRLTPEGKLGRVRDGAMVSAGSPASATMMLDALRTRGQWGDSIPCGEPLFQASPEPENSKTRGAKHADATGGLRRIPLATYLSRTCPRDFQFLLVMDECHELSTTGSAQEKAAHRLTALRRPTLLLTGSWMNGYADSLFAHQWALFQDFREEFPRTARTAFVDRYGFREKYVPVSSKPVVSERGAVSDRELKDQEKDRGVAPGVMPDFLLRHLLPHCVTLQRSDFAAELPGCTEESVPIHAGDELHGEHVEFMRKLLETIKKDRFNSDLAGALFGQLNEAPSQLDRCTLDTGNTPSGDFVMRYPQRVREKFPHLDVVSSTTGRPTSFLHPKEVWLLERLAHERAEGRRTMVMGWHTELFERYARLIHRAFGQRPPILYADKVPAAKRLEWIQKHVVDAGAVELIVNPATVGTGLNNLVHFATGVFMENPACNPQVSRQVKGRLDRIGQNSPVRFFWPHYAKTGQAVMLELLQRKAAIAMSVDGLDASTALQAVGVGEGYLTSISVSKALYDALIGDAYA